MKKTTNSGRGLFAKKKAAPAPAPEVKVEPFKIQQHLCPYSVVGLVNYVASKNQIDEQSLLRYVTLPPEGLNLATVVQAQIQNMFAIYTSTWRMVYQRGSARNTEQVNKFITTSISDFDWIRRGAQSDYLDNYLAGFRDNESMWLKNYDKIFDKLTYEFTRAAGMFHAAKSVIVFPPDMSLKPAHVHLLEAMWRKFELPLSDDYYMSFRFYVFTSSIPGTKASEKLEYLKKLPKIMSKIICLVADDINLRQLLAICKNFGMRGTFDPTKVKDKDGKFIKVDIIGKNTEGSIYCELLDVKKVPGAGRQPPVIFVPRKIVTDKVLKYYSGTTNVILY